MTWFIILIVALVGIGGLFALKHKEMQEGKVVALGEMREKLSHKITEFEARTKDKVTIPYITSVFASVSLTMTHAFARLTAKTAKWIEWRARSVAHKSAQAKQDVVHARENAFLKEVCEHKECLDTTEVAEANKL